MGIGVHTRGNGAGVVALVFVNESIEEFEQAVFRVVVEGVVAARLLIGKVSVDRIPASSPTEGSVGWHEVAIPQLGGNF